MEKIPHSKRTVRRQKRALHDDKKAERTFNHVTNAPSASKKGKAAQPFNGKSKKLGTPIETRKTIHVEGPKVVPKEAPKQSWREYGRSIFERRASIVKEGVGLPKKLFQYAASQNIRDVGNLMHKTASTFAPPALEAFLKVYGIVIGTYDPEHPDEFNREIAALSKALKLNIDNIAHTVAGTYNWGAKILDRTVAWLAWGIEKLLVHEMEYRISNLSKDTFIQFVNTVVKGLLLLMQASIDSTYIKVFSFCFTDITWAKLSEGRLGIVELTKTILAIISIPLFSIVMDALLSQHGFGFAGRALIKYIVKQVIAGSVILLKKLSIDKVIISMLRDLFKITGYNLGLFCVCLYYMQSLFLP